MTKLLEPITTTTELIFKLPEDICAKDSKLDLRIVNSDVMAYVHGARSEYSPIISKYNILNQLEGEARERFFDDEAFKENEIIYIGDGLVAVFAFRGLYKTDENEYVANYEYMEVKKESDLNN